VAAFRVIPYFSRTTIAIPPLPDLVDISINRLKQMEESIEIDPEEEDDPAIGDDLLEDD
jgi:hypothetical protein